MIYLVNSIFFHFLEESLDLSLLGGKLGIDHGAELLDLGGEVGMLDFHGLGNHLDLALPGATTCGGLEISYNDDENFWLLFILIALHDVIQLAEELDLLSHIVGDGVVLHVVIAVAQDSDERIEHDDVGNNLKHQEDHPLSGFVVSANSRGIKASEGFGGDEA